MMWIYLGLFLIGGAAVTIPVLGGCPTVTTMHNFDLTKYVGTWYEAEAYFPKSQVDRNCFILTYTYNKNGALSVDYQQIPSSNSPGLGMTGTVRQDNADKAKLTYVFPTNPSQFLPTSWIVDTDYKSYSVVWSCIGEGIYRNVRILTRSQQPEAAVLVKAHQALDKINISRASLIRKDQKNCRK